MADIKITELVALGTIQTGDVFAIVDVSDFGQAPSGSTRKLTIDTLETYLNGSLSFLSSVDLAYTSASRTITNTGGNNAIIPLFTDTIAGLVPLSGGGTTNFLRADGTWAAAGGGADGNGIYTGSGSLSGSTTVTMGANNLLFSSTINANLFNIDATVNRIGVNTNDFSWAFGANTAKFVINGGGTNRYMFRDSASNLQFAMTNGSQTFFQAYFSGGTRFDIGSLGLENVAIVTNNTPRLYITSTGDIGVGVTTGTSAKLHVAGNTLIAGDLTVNQGTAISTFTTTDSPLLLQIGKVGGFDNLDFNSTTGGLNIVGKQHFFTGNTTGAGAFQFTSSPTTSGVGTFIVTNSSNNSLNELLTLKDYLGDKIRFYSQGGGNATFLMNDSIGTAQHALYAGVANNWLVANASNLGIGTTSPSAKLHVAGTFKLVDGSQQNGYVLTSDATGLASWQPAAGGADGNGIYTGSGSLSGATTVAMGANDLTFDNGDIRLNGQLAVNVVLGGTESFKMVGDGIVVGDWKIQSGELIFDSSLGKKIQLYGGGANNNNIELVGSGVAHSVNSASNDFFWYAGGATSGTLLAKLRGNGNFGVGVATPSAKLEVGGDAIVNGDCDATTYSVNGVAGAVGGTFTTITSITVVDGIITAISGS